MTDTWLRSTPPDPVQAAPNQWVLVGPAVTIAGQTRVSGRITALAVSPDGQRIYAGTALGGVWYSGDGGGRWSSLDFYASTRVAGASAGAAPVAADAAAVGAIAVVWGTPATDVVYVGPTGRPAVARQAPDHVGVGAGGIGIRVAAGPAPAVEATGAAAADPWRVEGDDLTGLVVFRLAIDPAAAGVVWAATNQGVLRRDPASLAWVPVATAPANVSDVAAVPGPGTPAPWIYAATSDGTLSVSDDSGATWQPVALPPIGDPPVPGAVPPTYGRPSLAPGNVPNRAVVWLAATGGRLWRVEAAPAATATAVAGLPASLSGAGDLAVAVHPATDAAHRDLIAVGGAPAEVFPAGEPQAALYVGQVAGARFPQTAGAAGQPTSEWRGAGVPPGVRALAWVAGTPGPPSPAHLWAGTELGVFRSTQDGAARSFTPRNSGLAATECTALAQHRDEPGALVAGVAGLGAARLITGATWQSVRFDSTRPAPAPGPGAPAPPVVTGGFADPSGPGIPPSPGGGVAIEPEGQRRVFAQTGPGRWQQSVDGGRSFSEMRYLSAPDPAGPAARAQAATAAQTAELTASAPRSRMAATSIPRDTQGDQDGRDYLLALGTDRVWYLDAELATAAAGTRTGWVTLPTGTDPYDPAGEPRRGQDQLAGAVLSVRIATPERVYALSRGGIYLMQRNVDRSWQALHTLYDQASVQRNWKGKTPRGQIAAELPLLELAVHDPTSGLGTLYAGTGSPASATGEAAADDDRLWWFDGEDAWKRTGLPVGGAVHAVAVDPEHPEIVFVGTDVGVWRGEGNLPGGLLGPSWSWTHLSDALPEAPCVDLEVHPPTPTPAGAGAARVLRAAIAGRGVWEVALDTKTQGPEASLHAHPHDVRRAPVPTGGARSPVDPSRAQVRLDASPDVRVWRAPGTAPARPRGLPVGPASDAFDIWHLQSALRAAGEPLVTDGRWSAAVNPALGRAQAALNPPLPANPTAAQVWDRVQAGSPLPFDHSPPDHADLVAHLRDEPDRWPKSPNASCVGAGNLARVYVSVHSRHWKQLAAARVQVALLKAPFATDFAVAGAEARPGWPNLADAPPLPAGWAGSLTGDRAVAPGQRGAWMAGTPWSYAGAAPNQFQPVPAAVDPANPQVIVFDVDLTGPPWSWPGWLLLAVVVADDDLVVAAETDVAQLVRTSRHVAARSVREARLLPAELVRYPASDISVYPTAATMAIAWAQSNILWSGLYFDSPAPEPALGEAGPPFRGGHNRNANNPVPGAANSWTVAWDQIHPKLGIAPIYWGQQDPGATGPFNLTVPFAEANAADAVAKAAGADIPVGTVIYVDFENAVSAAGLAYCQAFWRKIAESGFRPGVYAHSADSAQMRQEVAGLHVWRPGIPALPPGATLPGGWTVTDGFLMLNSAQPVGDRRDRDTLLHQWLFDTQCPPLPAANPVAANFLPDLDVSVVADPAYPERRLQALEIRFGKAAVSASGGAGGAIYAIRRGRPRAALWAPGAPVADPALDTSRLPYLWNPFSPPAALRSAVPVTTLLGMGYGIAEGEHVWRVQELRRVDAGPWVHTVVPQGDVAIDPLAGVVAADRTDAAPEAFAVELHSGLVLGARRDSDTGRWTTLRPLTVNADAGTGAVVTTPTRPTGRLAAVRRTPGQLDLCWADTAGSVQTASSAVAGTWAGPAPAADPTVRAHPLTNLCVVSRDANSMDLVYAGRRDATPDWRLYATPWAAAGGWGATAVIGGLATAIDPMVPIGLCARSPAALDVFATGLDGLLYTTTFTAGAWTALQQVGGAAVRIGAVEGTCVDANGDTTVVVTGRDGQLYAWNTGLPAATALERVTPLDLA